MRNIPESPAEPFIIWKRDDGRRGLTAREGKRRDMRIGEERGWGLGVVVVKEQRRGDSEDGEVAQRRDERGAEEWAGGEDEGFSSTISGTQVRGSKQGCWL